jgi:hypothetical protein
MELGFGITDPNGYQREGIFNFDLYEIAHNKYFNDVGFGPVVTSVWAGERVSTYSAFVKNLEQSSSSFKLHRYSYAQNVRNTTTKQIRI